MGYTYLPGDGWGDGVKNSFLDRAKDATTRMSNALAVSNQWGRGMTWVGTSSPRQITFTVADQDDITVLGTTSVGPLCTTVHGTKKAMPVSVLVIVNVRSDWFTQDDSRRSYWENCPGSSYSGSYTCQKKQDVGSVMLHELGHAVGLAHPAQVKNNGHGSNAPTLAKCAVVNDQATMCQADEVPGVGHHRTHRRTLDNWDVLSLQYHY